MACRLSELVLDSHDPERLASFWCDVLGYVVLERVGGSVEIGTACVGVRRSAADHRVRSDGGVEAGQAAVAHRREPDRPGAGRRALAPACRRRDPCGHRADGRGELARSRGSGRKRVLLAPPARHSNLTSSWHSRQAVNIVTAQSCRSLITCPHPPPSRRSALTVRAVAWAPCVTVLAGPRAAARRPTVLN